MRRAPRNPLADLAAMVVELALPPCLSGAVLVLIVLPAAAVRRLFLVGMQSQNGPYTH